MLPLFAVVTSIIITSSSPQDVAYFDLSELSPYPFSERPNFRTIEPPLVYMQSQKHIERSDRYTEVPLEEPLQIPRPKFHTNIQRIPKEPQTPHSSVQEILKRYIGRLRKQRRKPNKIREEKGKLFEQPLTALKNKTVSIANKFLSLFTVVQFPNSKCQVVSSSSEYEGTCFHETECQQRNGTALGDCANGYGVCCVFRFSCGSSSNQNCSYFESPGYPGYYPPGGGTLPPTQPPVTLPPATLPTPDPRDKDQFYHHLRRTSRQDTVDSLICSFMISRISDDVQQMRIDFLDLELKGPTNGECFDERLVISGQNLNDPVPVICGFNTGQHVYVDVSGLNGPLQISVLANSVDRKRFRLRVCQLATSCAASMNCLQYYTGIAGVVSSFNYDQAAVYSRSSLNNLNYAVCIRKEAGYCGVTYTNVQNSVEYPFELVNVDDDAVNTVQPGQAGAGVVDCPNDYIIINGVRLCGYKLNDGSLSDFTMNAPITDSSAGPIVIPVRTDEMLTGRGFKLFYTQIPCPTF